MKFIEGSSGIESARRIRKCRDDISVREGVFSEILGEMP